MVRLKRGIKTHSLTKVINVKEIEKSKRELNINHSDDMRSNVQFRTSYG